MKSDVLFVRRGAVLVRDSNYNGWLYIVKSGSLQVLKKLVRTQPTVHPKTGRMLNFTSDADIYMAFKSDRPTLDRLLTACGIDYPQPIGDRVKHQQQQQNGHVIERKPAADDNLTLLTDRSFSLNSARLRRAKSAIIRTGGAGLHLGAYKQTRSETVVEFAGQPNSKRDFPLSLQKSEYFPISVTKVTYSSSRVVMRKC